MLSAVCPFMASLCFMEDPETVNMGFPTGGIKGNSIAG